MSDRLSGIRVTYTGLISFAFAILTLLAGAVFTLIVTRTLTLEEYGTWGLINGLLLYMMMIGPVISYWATREIARGIESGKTAVLASTILSIGAIVLYIIIAYLMGYQTNADQNVLVFASILVPAIFLNGILSAVNLGWKPHAISYATLIFAIVEIPLALIFVYFFGMGVTGVILTTLIAYFASIFILFIFARERLKNKFDFTFLKKWKKLFWLPLYPSIPIIIDGLGIAIFSIITESVVGLAFWTAAVVLPSMIQHAGLISRAVYPKLLGGGDKKYVEENLTQLFYFGILMTGIVITFARPGIFALNPIYENAVLVVVILAIRNFFLVLTNVFILNLAGIEKIDIKGNPTFRDYIKSKLFHPHTLRLIQTSMSMAVLTIGLLLLIPTSSSDIDLLIFWALVTLLTQIPLTVYLYILMHKELSVTFDHRSIFKYIMIGIGVFGMTYVITEQFLIYVDNVIQFVPNLLLFVGLGIGGYLIITYFADLKTKNLFKAIFNEIKTKKS